MLRNFMNYVIIEDLLYVFIKVKKVEFLEVFVIRFGKVISNLKQVKNLFYFLYIIEKKC